MSEFLTYLSKVLNNIDLTDFESERMMQIIIKGGVNPSQISSYFTALYMKNIKYQEILGAFRYLNYQDQQIDKSNSLTISNTFSVAHSRINLELPIAAISRACDTKVIFSSPKLSTSNNIAQLLENLGYNTAISLDHAIEIYKKIGISYLPNNLFNNKFIDLIAMQNELPFDILLNCIQPFLMPIRTTHILIYLTDERFISPTMKAAFKLGYIKVGLYFRSSQKSILKLFEDGQEIAQYIFNQRDNKHFIEMASDNYNPSQYLVELLSGRRNFYYNYINDFALSSLILMNKALTIDDAELLLEEILDKHMALLSLKNLIAHSNEILMIET